MAKHPSGDPFKGPSFAHKDGKWNWERSDMCLWDRVEMVGLLLKDLIVIDIDGKQFLEFYENHFPCLQTCPKDNTKKGAHYFFARTELCDAKRLYDGARALKSTVLPAEDNNVLPIDIKTVCSTGTCGFLVVTPSTDKAWVQGREPWTLGIHAIPDELVEALCELKKPLRALVTASEVVAPALPSQSGMQSRSDTRFAPLWVDFETIVRGLNLSRHFGPHTYPQWTSPGWAMDNVGLVGGYQSQSEPAHWHEKCTAFLA